MMFTIRLPYRKSITSIKHEDLLKLLEPHFGKNREGGVFIGADWGPGWDDIIYDLHRVLVEESPDYVIHQIKEKFATLRFYIDTTTDFGHSAIEEAEYFSSLTCEECGRPGTVRDDTYWLVTLCEWDRKVRNINITLWNWQKAPYTLYWKTRFAINRWRRKRKGSAEN